MYGYFHCRSHIVTVLTCESHYFTDSLCMEVAWSWILFLMYSWSHAARPNLMLHVHIYDGGQVYFWRCLSTYTCM